VPGTVDESALRLRLAELEAEATRLADVVALSAELMVELEIARDTERELAASLEIARKEAHEASHAKSAFLAGMSHELRTPLNAIIGYAELMHEEATDIDAGQLASDATLIHGAGTHLLGLIDQVLDLSKVEAGKMVLQCTTFSLPELVDEVMHLMRPVAGDLGLGSQCGPGIGEIYTDRQKLHQCLLNLVGNAIRYTHSGSVSIVVTRDDAGLSIEVCDTGCGMNKEDLAIVFEPFVQAKPHGVGTGLGLAITASFVRLMGGRVSVKSEAGVGSAFAIQLPPSVLASESQEVV